MSAFFCAIFLVWHGVCAPFQSSFWAIPAESTAALTGFRYALQPKPRYKQKKKWKNAWSEAHVFLFCLHVLFNHDQHLCNFSNSSCNRIPSFDTFQGLPAQNVVHQHKAQSLLTPCVLSVCVLQGEGVSIDGDRGRASCQCSTSQRNGHHSPDWQRDKLQGAKRHSRLETRAVIHCGLCNHCSHLHCDLGSNHCLGTSAPWSHSEHFPTTLLLSPRVPSTSRSYFPQVTSPKFLPPQCLRSLAGNYNLGINRGW